ncbi:hypothetical protein [Nonomuraea diastatica]|uniref:Outer membrane channel protein CpnT-like N-terminal domain-containing protein n=1 Tax=Nonomuraea diastatica TaxID=1848329 RepID=A0A4R4VQ84_9ACTN|nr:hypothetical protein [Nonomuraea diastatica]TDD07331.1 hypothetical protein E1294_48295 [Nonomuraea diastatica]
MDGVPIPEQVRPWIGWVVGMDWPEADEVVLFRLADDLALAFHRINGGVRGDGSAAGGAAGGAERGDWDGAALRRFVDRVGREAQSRKEELLKRLAGLALACNDLGVQVQYVKRMIKASVLLLIVQLSWLLWAMVSPASGVAWAAAGARAQAARMTVRQLRNRLLFNVALFGTLMGGIDLYVQASQSRREEIDWDQVGWSAVSGALTGVSLTLSTGLLPPRSVLGLMGHSAVAGGGATLATMLLSGQPIDWEMVAKGTTAGALGGADAHWASWNPGTARHTDSGPPPAHDPAAAPGRSPHQPPGSDDPRPSRAESTPYDPEGVRDGQDPYGSGVRRESGGPAPETGLAGAVRDAPPAGGHAPARPSDSPGDRAAPPEPTPAAHRAEMPATPERPAPGAAPHVGGERLAGPEGSHRPDPVIRREGGGQATRSQDASPVARPPGQDLAPSSPDGAAGPGTRAVPATHAARGPDPGPALSGLDQTGGPGSARNRIDLLINHRAEPIAVTPNPGDPGHGGLGRPTVSPIPPHPGFRPMPPLLMEAVQQLGENDGGNLGGGINARRVRTFDFEGADWVLKEVRIRREADAEVLGSILGERLGANVPPVYRVDATTVVMPFVGTGAALLGMGVLPTNLSAKLLGFLHVLGVDADANLRNIIRDENGDVWGIDMSGAFYQLPEQYRGKVAEMTNSPFADYWVSRKWDGMILKDYAYIKNELSPTDVERLAARIWSGRPYFEGLGRTDWFDGTWHRFLKIAENASGSRSIFEQE